MFNAMKKLSTYFFDIFLKQKLASMNLYISLEQIVGLMPPKKVQKDKNPFQSLANSCDRPKTWYDAVVKEEEEEICDTTTSKLKSPKEEILDLTKVTSLETQNLIKAILDSLELQKTLIQAQKSNTSGETSSKPISSLIPLKRKVLPEPFPKPNFQIPRLFQLKTLQSIFLNIFLNQTFLISSVLNPNIMKMIHS